MYCKYYERFFLNFSNKTKLAIILTLKEKPLSVTEIKEKLQQEQSKISHNLKKMAACNLINAKQEGKRRIYSLNKDTVMPILKLVEKHVKNHCHGGCCK